MTEKDIIHNINEVLCGLNTEKLKAILNHVNNYLHENKKVITENTDSLIKDKNYDIYQTDEDNNIIAIKRVSDGEIFNIHDIVLTSNKDVIRINKFYIKQGNVLMVAQGDNGGRGHARLSKITKLCNFKDDNDIIYSAAKTITLDKTVIDSVDEVYEKLKSYCIIKIKRK